MIPWELIDTAAVPGGKDTLRFMRRGTEFAIFLGRIELMNSRRSGSEVALANLACARLKDRPRLHMLIGGLGMGFTLRAALAELGKQASVTVAELVPEVVAWARGEMSPLHGDSLADPRLDIHTGDVRALIASQRAAYDAILLDVDNGPEGLSRESNDRLYDWEGLATARNALRPGGILAVWSAGPDREFASRLRKSGFKVDEVGVRAGRGRGVRQVVWLATK